MFVFDRAICVDILLNTTKLCSKMNALVSDDAISDTLLLPLLNQISTAGFTRLLEYSIEYSSSKLLDSDSPTRYTQTFPDRHLLLNTTDLATAER